MRGLSPVANNGFKFCKGGEGAGSLLEQGFHAVAEVWIGGCMVIDELVAEFIDATEIGQLGVVLGGDCVRTGVRHGVVVKVEGG